MNIRLAENIKIHRKEHSLTQEQLAEALGVTVGAVYKWEAGLSIPDINTIIELADFFDTSVDVLLGYELKDNKREAIVKRLKACLHSNDVTGLAEAEKALKKYPNSFEVVYSSAKLYQVVGLEKHDKKQLRRSLALFEQALLLMEQNTDPEISALSIHINIAQVYMSLEETDTAIALLKKHNICGINDAMIGEALAAEGKHIDEAVGYLSKALLEKGVSLIQVVMGYVNVFFYQKEYEEAKAVIQWMLGILPGLRRDGKSNFLDKLGSTLYACLAMAQLKTGTIEEARAALRQAKDMAESFDAAPDYAADSIRFVALGEQASAHDDLGTTAMEGIQRAIAMMEDKELAELWKEMLENETE